MELSHRIGLPMFVFCSCHCVDPKLQTLKILDLISSSRYAVGYSANCRLPIGHTAGWAWTLDPAVHSLWADCVMYSLGP